MTAAKASLSASALTLCPVDSLPNPGATVVDIEIDGRLWSILLLRCDNDVRGFLNRCPHAGRRLDWAPGKLLLDRDRVVCAAHGAVFSIPDGLCVGGPCRGESLPEIAVSVREGQVILPAPDDITISS